MLREYFNIKNISSKENVKKKHILIKMSPSAKRRREPTAYFRSELSPGTPVALLVLKK